MLNRLLSRQGLRVGAIVTAGHEDTLRIERAIQTHLGYPYGDRLHVATHHHNPPLIPRELVFGVRGRIDVFGEEVLPLREADVRDAARALIDAQVDGIVVGLLSSYRNGAHEQRVAEIVREELAAAGRNGDGPGVFVSSELYPSRRDLPRLNSTIVEAYAAEPSRGNAPRGERPHPRARGGVRAPRHGRARGDDLDRGPRAGAHARLRPDRRRRRRAHPRRPARPARTCCAPTSAGRRSTSR